jgi:hypothetical protein
MKKVGALRVTQKSKQKRRDNISFESGDACFSKEVQDLLYQYLGLVFSIKNYLKSS